MIVSHPDFETPDTAQVIWRYQSLGLFLWMLQSKQLHFTRADQFDDQWEGEYTLLNQALLRQQEKDLGIPPGSFTPGNVKKTIFLNCWHEKPYESAAMWKVYGEEGHNVAIMCTIGSLRHAMSEQPDEIMCGRVRYIDYTRDVIPMGNIFFPFLHKRLSFEYEKELRLVAWSLQKKPPGDAPAVRMPPGDNLNGINIPIDPKRLILAVRVSPQAQDWYLETVKALVQHHGLDPAIVTKSSLASGPLT